MPLMTPEWLTTFSSIATLLVVAVTAFAAIRQIRHMRAANQVAAFLPLTDEFTDDDVRESLNYLLSTLKADLEDPQTRAGLMTTPISGPARRALPALNFYERLGVLVVARVVDLELVLRYFSALPSEVWLIAEDYIAILRRTLGNEVLENLEALVVLENQWALRHGTSLFPPRLERLPLQDRYADADGYDAAGTR